LRFKCTHKRESAASPANKITNGNGKKDKKSRKTGKPELEPWQTRTKHGQANAKSPNAKETTHVHAEQEGSHKAHRKRNKKRQQGEKGGRTLEEEEKPAPRARMLR